MARDLLTIRCPDDIKQAVEERMSTSGKAKTDVVLELLRTALGMPSTATNEVSIPLLDDRITVLLDNRTTELYDQLNARVEEAIAPVKEALGAMATQWEEYKKERQETYNQWLTEARELGRELERAKQQSPLPIKSAPPVASSTPAAKGKVPRVAPKSQRNKSGRKQPGVVLARVEANLIRGQERTADELAEFIGVTAQGIRARRDAEEKGSAENLAEWGLRFIPNSKPQKYERI